MNRTTNFFDASISFVATPRATEIRDGEFLVKKTDFVVTGNSYEKYFQNIFCCMVETKSGISFEKSLISVTFYPFIICRKILAIYMKNSKGEVVVI